MKVIGITGGIGTGKSTVTDYLKSKGFEVIDADEISRNLTKGKSETVVNLGKVFGHTILNEDGTLNRKGLADIVFNDDEKKQVLENIVTKKVIELIENKLDVLKQENKEKLVFIDAPLLFETDVKDLIDFAWCVVADEEIRIERVIARDNCNRQQVLDRMKNQLSDEVKTSLSDEILDNSGGKEDLYSKIDGLLGKYAKL